MFGILPHGFEDEWLYGIIARYLTAFGDIGERRPLRETLHGVNSTNPIGLHGLRAVLERGRYPSMIEVFQRYLFDHTLVPYVLACLPGFEASALLRLLLNASAEKTDSRMMSLVFGRGAARAIVRLRFCLQCCRDDLAGVGFAYWHRCHQLPLTRVCWKHRYWLSEVDQPSGGAFLVRPTDAPAPTKTRVGSGRPTALSIDLALADKAMLDAGQTGFLGGELRQSYIDLARLSGGATGFAVGREQLERAVHDTIINPGLRRCAADRRDTWAAPLLTSARENERFRCDEHMSIAYRHVVVLTLAGRSIDSVGAAARLRLVCDASTDFELCGSRPCSRYIATWDRDLTARANLFNVRVRACCAECGFRATLTPGEELVQLQNVGHKWLDAAVALYHEDILTAREQALALGVTERELERQWTAAFWKSRATRKYHVPHRVFGLTATTHDWTRRPTMA
jgi:hypothetical protein